jgi:hypothetical protein
VNEAMKMRKRKTGLVIFFRVLWPAVSLNNHLWAVGLSFSPYYASTRTGNSIDVYAVISGPGCDLQVHSFRNLDSFEFNIQYDNSRTGISQAVLTDAETQCLVLPGRQKINFSDFSYMGNFTFQSPDAMSLAAVSFFGTGLKKESLLFSNLVLGEDRGSSFSASFGERFEPQICTDCTDFL